MNTFGLLFLLPMLGPLFLLSRVRPGPRWHSAYLPTLDGWRALACALVVIDHVARGLGFSDRSPLIHGQHGVNIFFGLSGLLITTKLLEEREQTGSISLLNFYRRRVFRLFPAAFLFLATVAVLANLGSITVSPKDFTACVFYFRNFCDSFSSLPTAHFWSLAIEEQFYLLIPMAFLLLGTRNFRWFALIGIAVSAFSRWHFFSTHPGYSYLLAFRTDMRVDGLLAGCLMATILAEERSRTWLKRALHPVIWALLGALLLWWIHRHGEYTTVVESLLVPAILAGTVLHTESWIARVLECKPLRVMGRASYSLYLWQQLFTLHATADPTFSALQRFPFNIAAMLICSGVSYYVVERPVLKWGMRDPLGHTPRPTLAET